MRGGQFVGVAYKYIYVYTVKFVSSLTFEPVYKSERYVSLYLSFVSTRGRACRKYKSIYKPFEEVKYSAKNLGAQLLRRSEGVPLAGT